MTTLDNNQGRAQKRARTTADNDPTYTIDDFCAVEHISRSQLYKAWQEGRGPRFYWWGNSRRITSEARREWQREREAECEERAG